MCVYTIQDMKFSLLVECINKMLSDMLFLFPVYYYESTNKVISSSAALITVILCKHYIFNAYKAKPSNIYE